MIGLMINADLRETTGKGDARRMRRAGLLPGIIYGGGKPDLAITLNANETGKALNVEAFHTSMLKVEVAGKGTQTVLLKDVQWDPLKDTAMHLDFFRVEGSDQVEVEIPITLINDETAPGVKEGGMIDMIRRHLLVMCRADSIPEEIIVDCGKLEIGEAVHILDVELPAGVVVPEVENVDEDEEPVNFTLVVCGAPTVEEKQDDDDDASEVVAEGEGSATPSDTAEE